jgi:CBS domain containing-hemolysin-like protein
MIETFATIDIDILVRLGLLAILLVASAFFAGTEVALFSLTRIEIDRIKARNPRAGERVESLLARPQKLLITIYIGNELTNVAISAVITVVALELFGDAGLALAMGVGALALLVFGEITPKTFAHYHNHQWAALAALPLTMFMSLIWPLREAVTWLSGRIVRLFGGASDVERVITEDELMTLVEEGADEGIIDRGEMEMIQSVFDLGDMSVHELMTPRTDMMTLDVATPLTEAWEKMAGSAFARAPVYRDTIDNVVGIFFKKDLLKTPYPPTENITLESLLRPPFIVPETLTVNELLREFKRKKTHMAVAMDEYGGVTGVVTLDDVISELVSVGVVEGSVADRTRRIGEGVWSIPADIDLDEFSERFGAAIEHEEIETIGGYVFHHLGRPPEVGDAIDSAGLRFTVEEVAGRRISRLRISFSKPGGGI